MTDYNSTQPAFSAGIISTELFSRIDYSKLASGLKQCENWTIRPAGGAEYRTGTKYIGQAAAEKIALVPFSLSREKGYCLEFSDKMIRFLKDGEFVKTSDGTPYSVATTYTADEVKELKFAQNKNSLYIVHQNHCPAILTCTSDASWTLVDMVFNPNVPKVSTVTIAAKTAKDSSTVVTYDSWQYAASIYDADGNEGLSVKSNIVSGDIDLTNQNIKVTITVPSTGLSDGDYIYLYRIYRGDFYFIYKIPYVDGTTSYTLTDVSFSADTTKSIKSEFTTFKAGNYPAAVGFWNQRLLFANTQSSPNTIYGSNVGVYDDFTNTVLVNSDEAFELTLSSGTTDVITDLVPMDDLILMTEGKIWRVVGTSASNMSAYIESYSGTSGLRPFVYKKSILYVDSSFNTVSNFIYSYELNGYTGQNLDILCRDLLEGYQISDVSFRDTPFGVLYCVRSDGTMLVLTYLKEENIYAWATYKTDGQFLDVCVIDKSVNDDIYVAVKRDAGVFLELFQPQINITQGVDDSWHLDWATKYSGEPTDTVTGLPDYYNGRKFSVVADGNEYTDVTVTNNTLTLDNAYSNILIGLPYTGVLEPVPVDLKFSTGATTVGANRKISKATIRYYRSRGLWYGISIDKLYQIKTYTYNNFGEDIPLETNVLNTEVSDTYKTESSFVIVQKSPFPALLQSITLGFNYGEKN